MIRGVQSEGRSHIICKFKIKGGITMGKVSEAIMRFMLNEKLIQRFEEKAAKGKTAPIDVFLRKGKEYIIRGRTEKGSGKPVLSLVDVTGSVVGVQYGNSGSCIEVTPEKDGPYRIGAAVKHTEEGRESITVTVALSYRIPPPKYVLASIKTLPCESNWPGFKEYELTEEPPEKDATVETEYKGSGTNGLR